MADSLAAAAFTGWSRIESDNHHVKDVIAGAVIGMASAYWFTTPLNGNIHMSAFSEGKTYGLMIQGNW